MEEKEKPSKKIVMDEEEVNGIVIDSIWNLENLPRTMSIN